jgi:hypothetical protein
LTLAADRAATVAPGLLVAGTALEIVQIDRLSAIEVPRLGEATASGRSTAQPVRS